MFLPHGRNCILVRKTDQKQINTQSNFINWNYTMNKYKTNKILWWDFIMLWRKIKQGKGIERYGRVAILKVGQGKPPYRWLWSETKVAISHLHVLRYSIPSREKNKCKVFKLEKIWDPEDSGGRPRWLEWSGQV